MNLFFIHNQEKGHLPPSTHLQWSSHSTFVGRDCLTMPYFLKVWKYVLWSILTTSNAFHATFLPTTTKHDLVTWQRCHNIEGVIGKCGRYDLLLKHSNKELINNYSIEFKDFGDGVIQFG